MGKTIHGRSRYRSIDYLKDPVGVIILDVDGKPKLKLFDPDRPLSSILILKEKRRLSLVAEVGLRKRRPYRMSRKFFPLDPEAHLT